MYWHQQRAEKREQLGIQVSLRNSRLNIIIKENEESSLEIIKRYVINSISEAELLDESAGALMYSIPFTQTDQITEFLRNYEQDNDIRALIEDISISNSTLEEVFIKVTKEDDLPQEEARIDSVRVNLREESEPIAN